LMFFCLFSHKKGANSPKNEVNLPFLLKTGHFDAVWVSTALPS
jgi:hypothetical protein